MMIVRFTTGNHFSPQVDTRVDIFTSRNQMKKDKPIYTGFEPLKISAQNAACMLKARGGKEAEIIFQGYLPDYSKNIVTGPFQKQRIAVSFQQV